MGNSKKKNFIKYGYIALATFVATKLVGGVCILFSAMLIASLLLAGKVLFELLDQEDITGKRVFIAIAIVLLMMGIGVYHRFNCHKAQSLANPEISVECEDETDDCTPVQNPVETQQTSETDNTPKRNTNVQKPSASDVDLKKDNTVKETIKKNNADIELDKNEVGPKNEDNEKQKEDIEKEKEEGKTANEQENGIITIKDDKKPEDNKEENKPIVIDTDKADKEAQKIVSNESNKDQKPSEKLEEKEDKLHEDSDDLLKDLKDATKKNEVKKPVKETKKEDKPVVETKAENKIEVETKTEEVLIESEPEVETKIEEVEETETKEVETYKPAVEIETQKVEDAPIKVQAIDGYEGFVGSDIQFKVSGDNVVVDGIKGTDSNFNSETGMLTINSAEATVVTVELSNGTSNVTFDVVVNGIVK